MRRPVVIHPILLAVFPVLFLFAQNAGLFAPGAMLVPLVAVSCLALLAWSTLSLFLKSWERSGLIVSLFLLLLFSYESCFDSLSDLITGVLGAYILGTRAYVLLIWGILFTVGTYFLTRTRRNLHNVTNIANVVAGVLVAMSLTRIGVHEVNTRSLRSDGQGPDSMEMEALDLEEASQLPNIYYIIVDEYARADTLEKTYGYDNREFLKYLEGKGFHVATRSNSNYCQTILSLASSLNMSYLDNLTEQVGMESDNRVPAINMIKDNTVFRFLKGYGYKVVAFSSGYSPTEIRNADVYLTAREHSLDEFQSNLLNMTPIPFVARQLGVYDEYDLRRESILYTIDNLADLSQLEGPIFVFAHIVAPHQPFVFGQHGEAINPGFQFSWADDGTALRDQYLQHYADQVIFINSRIQAALDRILSTSDAPPIIVLQADTGPCPVTGSDPLDTAYLQQRFPILSAIYVPDSCDIHLYDKITPVNTFRLVFSDCFGANYELLEDESYFSTSTRPYEFINVTDEVNRDIDSYNPES